MKMKEKQSFRDKKDKKCLFLEEKKTIHLNKQIFWLNTEKKFSKSLHSISA